MIDDHNPTADILIIGGGLSGTMLAVQLLRRPGKRRILIVETREELGRGEAYSATEIGHTLNGNAARMSADADDADDLTRWLTEYLANGGWPEAAAQRVPVAGRRAVSATRYFRTLRSAAIEGSPGTGRDPWIDRRARAR